MRKAVFIGCGGRVKATFTHIDTMPTTVQAGKAKAVKRKDNVHALYVPENPTKEDLEDLVAVIERANAEFHAKKKEK